MSDLLGLLLFAVQHDDFYLLSYKQRHSVLLTHPQALINSWSPYLHLHATIIIPSLFPKGHPRCFHGCPHSNRSPPVLRTDVMVVNPHDQLWIPPKTIGYINFCEKGANSRMRFFSYWTRFRHWHWCINVSEGTPSSEVTHVVGRIWFVGCGCIIVSTIDASCSIDGLWMRDQYFSMFWKW